MKSLLVAVCLLSRWVGPMFALIGIVALARRWFHSSKRRNPLTSELLRGPGHTLRKQLDDALVDMMTYLSVSSSTPLFVVALYLASGAFDAANAQKWWIPASASLGVFAFMAYKIVRLVEKARNLKLGLEAECAVGEELNLLMKGGI